MKDFLQKHKGLPIAEVAKKIEAKYPDRDFDPLQRRSYETAMTKLINHQEKLKLKDAFNNMKQQYMNGGKLEYGKGGKLKYTLGAQLPFIAELIASMVGNTVGKSTGEFKRKVEANKLLTNPLPSNVSEISSTPKMEVSQAAPEQSFGDKLSGLWNKAEDWVKNDADAPAAIGKGIEMVGNAAMLAGGADRERPVYNPYEEDTRRIMAGRSTDNTAQRNAILSARNAALANNSNYARSKNVQAALNQNIEATTGDQIAQSLLQQDQLNEGFAGQLAATLNNLGQQRVQAETFTNELNARNIGNYQTQLSRFLSDMSDTGIDQTNARYNASMNKVLGEILNNKYADFGVDMEVFERVLAGKGTPEEQEKVRQIFLIKSGNNE